MVRDVLEGTLVLDRVCDCVADMRVLVGGGEDRRPTYTPRNDCHIALISLRYVCGGAGGAMGVSPNRA